MSKNKHNMWKSVSFDVIHRHLLKSMTISTDFPVKFPTFLNCETSWWTINQSNKFQKCTFHISKGLRNLGSCTTLFTPLKQERPNERTHLIFIALKPWPLWPLVFAAIVSVDGALPAFENFSQRKKAPRVFQNLWPCEKLNSDTGAV